MKTPKFLLTVVLLVTLTSGYCFAQNQAVKTLSPAQTEKLAKDSEAVVLIDVRTPEEVAEGHLKGAKPIDIKSETFQQQTAKLDKNKTYILYCKAGVRSEQAARRMLESGFTSIYSLEGGIDAWKAAGKPIEK
ncbi:rhodanese-like domain-containing protein [Algoriphagus halophytocola]|uniref:Rhodanese-like domain-containing protein n=1 Tax=Algoriphagus halophytocola TaxID=2991499 RepID=A0ABY6MF33_9BACT|nr:rhodanese-like domain-containing protein [Algoriphagus sp. TR-M5]UZD22401.1 rhodanese-like domain-containing protein [Algoriphagus sp. TR-M5]